MRTTDRILSLLVALLAVVLGVVVLIEVIGRAVGHAGHVLVPWEPVARFFREHIWSSTAIVVLSVALILAGLLLLLVELKPRRPGLLGLQEVTPGVLAAVDRRSVARAAVAGAEGVTGVNGASADVRGRKLSVSITSALHDPAELEQPVSDAVRTATADMGLVAVPDVTVHTKVATP